MNKVNRIIENAILTLDVQKLYTEKLAHLEEGMKNNMWHNIHWVVREKIMIWSVRNELLKGYKWPTVKLRNRHDIS